MKRSVRSDLATVAIVVALTLAVVAITDASAGATQLILIGFLAVAIAIRLGPERLELWREEHGRGEKS
jgi:hypothetical protein